MVCARQAKNPWSTDASRFFSSRDSSDLGRCFRPACSLTFVGEGRYGMTNKRSGIKVRRGAPAKTEERTTKKGSLRDLGAKDGQRIRGGKWSRENGSVSSSTSSS